MCALIYAVNCARSGSKQLLNMYERSALALARAELCCVHLRMGFGVHINYVIQIVCMVRAALASTSELNDICFVCVCVCHSCKDSPGSVYLNSRFPQ